MRNFILKIINNVEDNTEEFNIKDIEDGKDMAVLCYIIPLIPYFLNKRNKFVKYHSIIGMNLFIIAIFYYIFFKMILSIKIDIILFQILLPSIWLIILLLCCIGISNVCSGKAKKLPFVDKVKIFR